MKNWYQILTHVKNRYQILTSVKNSLMSNKSSHVKTCKQILTNQHVSRTGTKFTLNRHITRTQLNESRHPLQVRNCTPPPAIKQFTLPSSQPFNDNRTHKGEYANELPRKFLETSVPYQFYPQNILRIYDSHFVPILTLRTDNSGIVPRKVRILILSAN